MIKIRLLRKQVVFLIAAVLFSSAMASAQVIPLPHAYAHNDYWHKRPLFDALDNGFTNIEADIYLRHSRLLVMHRPPIFKLRHKKTIEGLYLQPLLARLSDSHNRAQTSLDTIVLMIDIKSKGERTYTALKKVLHTYKDLLSTCDQGKVTIRNLTLVLTGHRPLNMMESEASRYVFADADLRKIDPEEDCAEVYNTASCKYSRLIKWKGKGMVPEGERERLEDLVNRAHLSGAKVRLWDSPDNVLVWNFLRDCGVDLINTDKLQALKHYFITDVNNQKNMNSL